MTDVPMVLAASETVSNSHPGGSSEARWRFLVSLTSLIRTASLTLDNLSQTLGMAAVDSGFLTTLTACKERDKCVYSDKPSDQ